MEMNSVQTQEVSDSTEKKEIINEEVKAKEVNSDDAIADRMPEDFKRDFFKHKQLMKEALEEKQELAEKLKLIEEEKNIKKGNYQTIIDSLKEENSKLKTSMEDDRKQKQYNAFKAKVSSKAQELGFIKPESIMSFFSTEDKKLLSIDEDHNVDEYGMEKAFENVKKEWAQLFKPKEIKIADKQIITNLNKKPAKTVKEMTSEERLQAVLAKTKKE